MKTRSGLFRFRNRGSTLLLTLIMATALLALVASLFSVLLTDKRVNRGVALYDEARNAAEGAMEVAAAEFDRRAISYGYLSDNPLEGYTLPTDVRTILSGGHVRGSSIEFKAGDLSSDSVAIINGDDPFNRPDPNKDTQVSLRHGYIYGKATAVDPRTSHEVTTYLSTLVQVREQSWLNYGIFGNLDLEFHAGPKMEITGPVHSNQNIYVLGGSDLIFKGPVTTTKRILRRFKDKGSTSDHGGTVKFPRKADPESGDLLAMAVSDDSTRNGFKDYAQARWKGYVQDVAFEVDEFKPPGMLSYREDDYTTTGTDETLNHAYALIEPQLADVSDDDVDSYTFAGYKGEEVENLKVSAVAGLIIRIKNKPSAYTTTQWWERIRKQDNDDADFEPGFELVFHTTEDPTRPPNRANYPERDGDGRPIENVIPLTPDRMSATLRNRLFKAIRLIQYREDTSSGSLGNRKLLGTQFRVDDGANADAGTWASSRTWFPIYDRRQGYKYNQSTNDGLTGAHHVLHIDLGAFHDFLNSDAVHWKDVADPDEYLYVPSAHWSGVLYVQLPLESYDDVDDRADEIRPAFKPTSSTAGYAVVLRNGETLPVYNNQKEDGFVFGCNGSVYVLSHFNADGDLDTGSSTEPDGTDEISAIIAADAVTLLSSNYSNTYFEESAIAKKSAGSTEFSAAVFAGVVPTRLTTSGFGINKQRMGGVHNFVRYLEDWGSKTYCYRGSMALLFESEVATKPYYEDKHGYWYSPPTRDVGYHIYFETGKHPKAWPPVHRTNRRIRVDRISAADYQAGPPTP